MNRAIFFLALACSISSLQLSVLSCKRCTSTFITDVFTGKFTCSGFIAIANILGLIPTALIYYFILFNYPCFIFSFFLPF